MNYNILVKMNLEYTKSSIGSIDKVILHKIKHYKEKDKLVRLISFLLSNHQSFINFLLLSLFL